MTKPSLQQGNKEEPALHQYSALIIMLQTDKFAAPEYAIPSSPLMDDTSALMDDLVYLMGGTRAQGGAIPRLANKKYTPRMNLRTERPSMNGISKH